MIDVQAALRTLLLSDAAVNAAVASGGGIYRIYSGILPQDALENTLPSLVMNHISEITNYIMSGDDGLIASRIQIDAYASSRDAAVNLAGLVFDKLSGYSGTVSFGSSSPQRTTTFRAIFSDTARDDFDKISALHSRSRDYSVWYTIR